MITNAVGAAYSFLALFIPPTKSLFRFVVPFDAVGSQSPKPFWIASGSARSSSAASSTRHWLSSRFASDRGDAAHRRALGGRIRLLHREEGEPPRRLDADLRPGAGILRPDDDLHRLRLRRRPSLRGDRPLLRLHRHEFSGIQLPQASPLGSSSPEDGLLRSSNLLNARDPGWVYVQ